MRAKLLVVERTAPESDEAGEAGAIRPIEYLPVMEGIERREGSRAEWVAVMALIAELDRDEYRDLRREAWELAHLQSSSDKQN